MTKKKKDKAAPKKSATPKPSMQPQQEQPAHIPIVGIGASAGGLTAFKDLFEAMPPATGMAFVLIQHLDPTHESLMVDLLSRHTAMEVVQVEDCMEVRPNHVYMIPPNWDLAIERGNLKLKKFHQRRGMRMPIDFFFTSLAEDQRERSICIVLSGTGSDGTMGLKAVKSYGGLAVVQAPEEAQYDGMPSSALATGVVDYILPVKEIPQKLISYIKHSYICGHFGTEPMEISEPDEFNTVLAIMHAQLGHNFHYYKKNTLIRRIKRRMGLRQLEKMADYVNSLREDPQEVKELFKDMLIGVTGFFRESDSWKLLDQAGLNTIVEFSTEEQPVRVWVPGCSSGEEPYTIAMLLNERFEAERRRPCLQIFATDIDQNALEFARTGRYPESIASEIPDGLLQKYFHREDGFYQVRDRLRESVVFSEQNLIADPPFSKLDLITCRNLLIYLEANIQHKVMELFHFALKKNGFLMLGNSETIGQNQHLFKTMSKKWRIFRRLDLATPIRTSFPILPDRSPWARIAPGATSYAKQPLKPGEVVREALLMQFAPTTVLINRNHEILYHFGETSQYLCFSSGEPTNDLYSLCRQGLTTRLRGAVHKAIRSESEIKITGARVKRDDGYHKVSFTVTPLLGQLGPDGLLLVTFRELAKSKDSQVEMDVSSEDESVIKQLEVELGSTREELQNTIEELETSNEELKASNEEVMSMNEELQSSNEELETSKEELQSLNEELNTVNNELQEKVRSLEETKNDVTNLVNSTNIAAVFVDTKFSIMYYTPAAKNLFNLIPTDIGRPLGHLTWRFADDKLLDEAQEVLNTLVTSETQVETEDGEWFNRKIFPYRTQDRKIEGIVFTFDNITELQKKSEMLVEQNERFVDAQRLAKIGNWEYDLEKDQIFWSDEMYQIFGVEKETFKPSFDAILSLVHPEDQEGVRNRNRQFKKGKEPYNFTYRIVAADGGEKYISGVGRTECRERKAVRVRGAAQDVTERMRIIKELEEAEKKNSFQAELLRKSPVITAFHDQDLHVVWANKAYEEATGMTAKEMVGKKCFTVWGLEKECKNCPVVVALREGKPHQAELTPQNQVHWPESQGCWLSHAVPVRDEDGKIIGALESAIDITQQLEKEREWRLVYDSFNSSSSGAAILDQEGRVVFCNSTFLQMFAFPNMDQVRGKAMNELLETAEGPAGVGLEEALEKSVEEAQQISVRSRNGSPFPMELSSVMTKDRGRMLFLTRATPEKKN